MKKAIFYIVVLILFSNLLYSKEYVIGVIPKTMYIEYWQDIERGAKKAGVDLKVNIIYRGPNYEEDENIQIKIAEEFINKGVDAIVIAPADKDKLVNVIKKAFDKGIKIVVIDSAMSGKNYNSYVGTNNYKAGYTAGKEMLKRVKDKNSIMLLKLKKGNSSTEDREQGFVDSIIDGGGVVKYSEYGGVTLGESSRKVEKLIKNNDISGIFMSNGVLTEGVIIAIKKTGKKGIIALGFDTSENTKTALENKEITGVITQNPYKIGYTGVKIAVDILNGLKVEEKIDIEFNFKEKIK